MASAVKSFVIYSRLIGLVSKMSRVGNAAIKIPLGVAIQISGDAVNASRGSVSLTCFLPEGLSLHIDDVAKTATVVRSSDEPRLRSLHGLVRSLLANNLRGLVLPWEKRLEIVGVGYQASLTSGVLNLSVGFADLVKIPVPHGVLCVVPDSTHVTISGADRQLVGQMAANVRSVRPPEPYKGKGIRYMNEHVKRKSGKAFGS